MHVYPALAELASLPHFPPARRPLPVALPSRGEGAGAVPGGLVAQLCHVPAWDPEHRPGP